ncbi:hypothetical protein [Pseudogemmobacter sp. W21_MBD1_M6]|uniref:hypothetical protein n=1 Tax=Pseudogemmobacter sp. W21_MBD1_M6 TaxID=3240271 RepID=UPI003F953369
MADGNNSGGNGTLIFIVGGLVVAVGVLFYVLSGGDVPGVATGTGTTNITVEAPQGGSATAGATAEGADAGADTGTTGAAADATTAPAGN